MPDYMHAEHGNTYQLPGPFGTLRELRDEAKRRGSHYFDDDTTRYFNARYHDVIAGAILVDSIKHPDGDRTYRISTLGDGGSVYSVIDPQGGNGEYATLRQARAAAKRVAESCGVSIWDVAYAMAYADWTPLTAERRLLLRIAEAQA